VENFCFGPAGVAAVDFQYVGGGVGVKDVAYFLNSCLSPKQFALVGHYLDTYFDELRNAVEARMPAVDAAALESEWRALYPLACVDFYRFLLGWAPGAGCRDGYSDELTRRVLRELGR
jgi:hypothetical protein